MTANQTTLQTFEIVVDELIADEAFRDSFFRSPKETLRSAADWGLPLSESEIQGLIAAGRSVWEGIVDELDLRLQKAA